MGFQWEKPEELTLQEQQHQQQKSTVQQSQAQSHPQVLSTQQIPQAQQVQLQTQLQAHLQAQVQSQLRQHPQMQQPPVPSSVSLFCKYFHHCILLFVLLLIRLEFQYQASGVMGQQNVQVNFSPEDHMICMLCLSFGLVLCIVDLFVL